MFDKLSEELRHARENHGISLQQLANKTRIDIKFLKAIDEGNFSFLPDLYVKAFLKDYARNVGLDDKVIVNKYQAIKDGKSYDLPSEQTSKDKSVKKETPKEPVQEPANEAPAPVAPKPEAPKEVKREPVRLQPTTTQFDSFKGTDYHEKKDFNKQRNIIIAAAAGAVVLIAIIVYFLFIKSSNEIIVPEKPYEEIVQENSDRYSDLEPKKDTVAQTAPVVNDSLRLVIKSSDTSWVKLVVDNTKSEEFMLYPGSQKQLAAKENYKGTFGRAKAIQLELNGKPLTFDNKGRKTLNATIDTAGVHVMLPVSRNDSSKPGTRGQ